MNLSGELRDCGDSNKKRNVFCISRYMVNKSVWLNRKLFIMRHAMKSGKIVPLAAYRAEMQRRTKKTTADSAELPLPTIDCLWELLDRNISFAAWQEQQLGRIA